MKQRRGIGHDAGFGFWIVGGEAPISSGPPSNPITKVLGPRAEHPQPWYAPTMPKAFVNPWVHLEYEQFGPESGIPVVLIMGLGAPMTYWEDEFCKRLAGIQYSVIRFDNRDNGGSSLLDYEPVPDLKHLLASGLAGGEQPEVPYKLSDMAADTVGLLDSLGYESAHVVGVSLGGMIAQTMAIEHPSRVRSLTSMMSTTGDPSLPLPSPEAFPVLFRRPPKDRDAAIEFRVNIWRILTGPVMPFDEDRARRLSTLAFDRGISAAGTARQLAAVFASGSRREALKTVTAPTLVLHGTNDPLVPGAGGQDTADHIPGSEMVWLDGMGHTLHRNHWDRVISEFEKNAERADRLEASTIQS